jgi:hypothetical protein
MRKRCVVLMLVMAASMGAAHAWDSYEHSEVGDAAFLFAVAALDTDAPGTSAKLLSQPHLASDADRGVSISAVANGKEVTNHKNEVEQFSFGDLVAIYGDYAEGFNDGNDTGFGRRAANLKQIVRGGRVSDFPDELKILLSLAVNNGNHFSLRAAQAYVQNHRQALLFASQNDRLWQALHYEALALHSFTDDFALGHMLESRESTNQLVAWTKSVRSPTKRILMARIGTAFMGGLVNFYHNAYNWKGGMMENLAGDSWRGFGDKRYRIVDQSCEEKSKIGKRNCSDAMTQKQREVIVRAAATSILQVLWVASGKSLTAGEEYVAMCRLPVRYWDTYAPVEPENQMAEILELATFMRNTGRPIEDGFDFSLGILKYRRTKKEGVVDYIDYVTQRCGRTLTAR